MLTVVTQNSRLPRRSALSGDRMAFGFAAANDQLLARICAAASGFGRIPENICS
jgi:hypothetical protein